MSEGRVVLGVSTGVVLCVLGYGTNLILLDADDWLSWVAARVVIQVLGCVVLAASCAAFMDYSALGGALVGVGLSLPLIFNPALDLIRGPVQGEVRDAWVARSGATGLQSQGTLKRAVDATILLVDEEGGELELNPIGRNATRWEDLANGCHQQGAPVGTLVALRHLESILRVNCSTPTAAH